MADLFFRFVSTFWTVLVLFQKVVQGGTSFLAGRCLRSLHPELTDCEPVLHHCHALLVGHAVIQRRLARSSINDMVYSSFEGLIPNFLNTAVKRSSPRTKYSCTSF